jgi:hypothetical protein
MKPNAGADQGWVRALLWVGSGMLCFFALCPSVQGKGGGAEELTRVSVGLSFSPLYVHERARTEELDASGGKSVTTRSHSELSFFSWSMGALVASVVLMSIARALRRPTAAPVS